MGYSQYDAAVRGRVAWNAGKTVGTKRPLKQKQIWVVQQKTGSPVQFELTSDVRTSLLAWLERRGGCAARSDLGWEAARMLLGRLKRNIWRTNTPPFIAACLSTSLRLYRRTQIIELLSIKLSKVLSV